MEYKSILYWPEEIHLMNQDNSSNDSHHDEASAIAVCKTLIRKGFGCEGKQYPHKAQVTSNGVVVFEWNNVEGYIVEPEEPYNAMDEYYLRMGYGKRPKFFI